MGASPIRPYCAGPSTASAVTPAAREAHRKPTYACVSHPPGVGTNGNHMRPWRGITALPTPLRWAKPHTTSLRRPVSHFNHPIRSAKQRHAAAREAYRKPTLTKGGHKWQPYAPLARYNRPQTPLRWASPTQPHCAGLSTTSTIQSAEPNSVTPPHGKHTGNPRSPRAGTNGNHIRPWRGITASKRHCDGEAPHNLTAPACQPLRPSRPQRQTASRPPRGSTQETHTRLRQPFAGGGGGAAGG